MMESKASGDAGSRIDGSVLRLVPDVIVCATLAYLDLRAHLRLRATNRRFGRLSERPESAPASVALIVPKEQQVSSVLHTLSTLRAPGLELKEDREVRLRWYDNKDWVSHGVTNESLACLSRMTWLRDLEVRVRAGHASGDRMQGELLAPLVQLRSVSLTLEQCTVDLATLAPLTRLETLRVAWHGGRYVGDVRLGAALRCMPCLRTLRLEHRGGGTPESVFSWAHDGPTLPASLTSLHLGDSLAIVRDFSAGWQTIAHLRLQTLELCGLTVSPHSFASLLEQQPALVCVQVLKIHGPRINGDATIIDVADEDRKDVNSYLETPSAQMQHLRLFTGPEHLLWCVRLMPQLRTVYCHCTPTFALRSLEKTVLEHLHTLYLHVSSVDEAISALTEGWHAPALERLTLRAPSYHEPEALAHVARLDRYPNLRRLCLTGAHLAASALLPRLPRLEALGVEGMLTYLTYAGPSATSFSLAFPMLRSLCLRANGLDCQTACTTTLGADGEPRPLVHTLHDRTSLHPWLSYHPHDDDVWVHA